MDDLIKEYLKDRKLFLKEVKNFKNDEEFLYKLVEKGIGFGKIRKHHFRPPHGFHVGVTRKGDENERKRKVDRYMKQKQLTKQGIINKLIAYYKYSLFKDIMVYSHDRCIE